MIYKYKNEGRSLEDFRKFQNPIELFKNLRDGNVNTNEVLKNQMNFKSNLAEIKQENPDLKSKDQINVIQNVQNDLRETIIYFSRDYSFLMSEAKYEAKYGKGLKILTSKQTLQRLPIALAQLKDGSSSENLLNEIRQIIFSLYQAK